MRKISKIVIHCTANQKIATAKNVIAWLKKQYKNGNMSYHYLVDRNGDIYYLTEIEKIAYHASNDNIDSIGIAYVGGLDENLRPEDNISDAQINSINSLVQSLFLVVGKVKVLGHRDLKGVKKSCPCFDVKEKFKSLVDL